MSKIPCTGTRSTMKLEKAITADPEEKYAKITLETDGLDQEEERLFREVFLEWCDEANEKLACQ